MFIQIGTRAFNPDQIVLIKLEDTTRTATLYLINQRNNIDRTITFINEEYDAFMSWWENKASVYTISVPEEN